MISFFLSTFYCPTSSNRVLSFSASSLSILRRSKELTMSSPSVDPETDKLMQVIIRDEFAGCTIFSIAHRLDTILDFDKIAVLDRGTLIEFDEPAKLLAARPPSAFAKLYYGSSDSSSSNGSLSRASLE